MLCPLSYGGAGCFRCVERAGPERSAGTPGCVTFEAYSAPSPSACDAGTKRIESEFTQWRVFFGVKPSPMKT